MNSYQQLSIFKFFVFIFLVSSVGCQHSTPLDGNDNSQDGKPSKGYNLYVGRWGGNQVYVMDTDSNVVVDTLLGFNNYVWDLAVTKSGEKLYVSTREGPRNTPGKVYSVKLRTRQVSLIWSGIASDVFVAPNGEIIIISYEPRPEGALEGPAYLGTIDTLSDAITFIDTLDIRDTGYNYQTVVFDRNRPLLYAVNNSIQLFAYDYEKREVVRVYDNLYGPKLRMVISHDGKLLYVAGGPVFDLECAVVVGWVGINHFSSLALSPDGEYLYITDPGGYLRLEPVPSGKVFIFQTSTNSYVGEIDTRPAMGYVTYTDRIVIMPDGKTAYVSNWLNDVFVLDLQRRVVKELISFPVHSGQLVPMVLGMKP